MASALLVLSALDPTAARSTIPDTGAAPDHNVTIVINPPLRPTCLAAVIYGNRAVTRCEMDEQTGSVSETKRPPSGRKEVEVLTVSWPRCTKSDDIFNLRSLAFCQRLRRFHQGTRGVVSATAAQGDVLRRATRFREARVRIMMAHGPAEKNRIGDRRFERHRQGDRHCFRPETRACIGALWKEQSWRAGDAQRG